MAAHRVGVVYGSPVRPGLPRLIARRSPPRPTGTSSALRAASGSRSAQRHMCGTARGWGWNGIRPSRVSQSGVIPAASKSA